MPALRPLLGIHASTAGGVAEAVPRAVALGCESMQVFTRSQRQWKSKPLDDPAIAEFRARLRGAPVRQVISHDSYLINLASPDRALHTRSVRAFRDEMDRADALGIKWVVFHPGAHMAKEPAWGIDRIRTTIQGLLDATPGHKVGLAFENAAGQGTTLGRRLEELAAMIRGLTPRRRVGVCLDTCHLFAAGYDLRTKAGYESVMREVDDVIGFKRVKAFHLNDSKRELGSRVDRHENIGRGHIGETAFRCLLRDDRFAGLPMVLETPGGPEWFAKDLARLRTLGGYPRPGAASAGGKRRAS